MRSKYGTYPEYHTSLDDLALISPEGLMGAFELHQKCLMILEGNRVYKSTCICEPQMSRRGLYPSVGARGTPQSTRDMMNVLAYADGERDVIAIADEIGCAADECIEIIDTLRREGLVEELS